MTRFKQLEDRLLAFLGEFPLIKQAANSVLFSGTVIFALHRVLPRGADCFEPELCTSEDAFSNFLDWITEHYKVVTVDQVAIHREWSDSERPRCAITFDDGWLDNFTYAFPQLRRRGLPATIFLPSRYIGTNRRFWQESLWFCLRGLKKRPEGRAVIDKVGSRLPWFPPSDADLTSYRVLKQLLLSRPSSEAEEFAQGMADVAGLEEADLERSFVNWNEVKQMQASGIQFGSHTLNHTLLANTSPEVARYEIEYSREELKAKIGQDITGIAYPWGAVGVNSVEQVRNAGYSFAVTTKPGKVTGNSEHFLLPRVAVSDSVLDGGRQLFASGKARLSFAKNILTAHSRPNLARPESQRRIKILFVLDLITEWEGGTERQLRLLLELLDRRYFEPKLCFLFDAPDIVNASIPCPIRILCPNTEHIPSVMTRLWRLVRVLREERPDIVQCFFIEGLMMGILAGRIARVPKVIGSARNAGYWRKPIHRLIMKVITPLAHYWQTNSRYLWRFQKNEEMVSEDHIEILPNGLDISGFAPVTPAQRLLARKNLGLQPGGPVCVSIANLSPVKDLATLINTAALLKEKFPLIQFLLLGDGPMRDTLQALAQQLKVSDNVRFLGRHVDVRPYLEASDIGVLTSGSEGSSNAVLEYMAVGLPVVVSDIPPNRELLDGVFFRAGDASDFADKICGLWRDLDSGSKSHKNYKILPQFSLQKMIMRAESFYVRLAVAGRHS